MNISVLLIELSFIPLLVLTYIGTITVPKCSIFEKKIKKNLSVYICEFMGTKKNITLPSNILFFKK